MNRSKIKFEEIIDINNCIRAIKNASRNKQKRKKQELKKLKYKNFKPKKDSIIYIIDHIDEYAVKLQKFLIDLLADKEQLHQGKLSTINNDGTHNKQRELCKPLFFPDQCVHWAIMQIVNPVFEKGFDHYACASITSRGTHYAMKSVKRFVKDIRGTKYCGQFDIKGFYKNISKDILVQLFGRKIKDKRIVNLLGKILYSYKGDGLPLGYYPSGPFANFYLTALDRYAREFVKVKYYVRYMDDIITFGSNKRDLHQARKKFEFFVSQRRNLHLKSNWQVYKTPYDDKKGHITTQRATDFVGYRFFRYKTIIRKSIFLRMTRLYRKLNKGKYTAHRAYAFTSYNGYLKTTNSNNVKAKYINGKINPNKIKEIIRNESRKQHTIYNNAA